MLEFPQRGDQRGHLVVVEGNQDIPFEIKRVFYIYGSDAEVVRGKRGDLLLEQTTYRHLSTDYDMERHV